MAILRRIFNRLEYLNDKKYLNVLKTLYINFRYLPVLKAMKFPIYVYSGVRVRMNSGKIVFKSEIKSGMLKVGLPNYGAACKRVNTIFNNQGVIVVCGANIRIANGVELNIQSTGVLQLGSNVLIGECTRVVCANNIEMCSNVRVAHESQIIDTNFHYILNVDKNEIPNCSGSIFIASNNWIGNRSNINKGTKTAPYQIFSAGSLLNKDYESYGEGCIFVGTPARLLGKGYFRVYDVNIDSDLRKYYKDHSDVYTINNKVKELIIK